MSLTGSSTRTADEKTSEGEGPERGSLFMGSVKASQSVGSVQQKEKNQ